jgi:transcription initiation factor TFIID subunit 2
LNENSKNPFTDAYYRAALLEGLANTITPSIASLQKSGTSGSLAPEMHLTCEEICLRLNLEKIMPSYQFVVTNSCLR